MDNYFDKFDEQASGNYFDRFDANTPAWAGLVSDAQALPDRVSVPEALLISAGRTGDKLIAGVKQLSIPADAVPGDPRIAEQAEALEADQRSKDEAFSNIQREHPAAANIGQALPYIAVPPTVSALTQAGIVGGLEAMKYGTPEERVKAGIAGSTGTLAGNIISKGVGGTIKTGSNVTTTQRLVMENAIELGVKPRMSQVTNSPTWALIEDVSSRNIGGRGVMERFAGNNQRVINKTLAKEMGEEADDLSPQVFANANERHGKVFDEVANLGKVSVNGKEINPITINRKVGDIAEEIIRVQSKRAKPNTELLSMAEKAKMLSRNKGRIDGETYNLIRSDLSELSFDATGFDRSSFGKLLEALDDSAQASLKDIGKGDLAAALKEARRQYSAKKILAKGLVAEGGDANPARLAQVLRTQNPDKFRSAVNPSPMQAIAQYGENFKPLKAGSQTAERSPVWQAAFAIPSWLGAKASTSGVPAWYARNVGGTKAGRIAGEVAEPLARTVSYGLLNPLLFPRVPVVAE